MSSALIAGFEFTPSAVNCGLNCTFLVADEIPPQAKLVFGALLGALMWLARRRRPRGLANMMIRDAAAGAIGAILVAELLPEGFGIFFLDGFLPAPNALYSLGAAAGGVLGTLLERSCRRQLIDA